MNCSYPLRNCLDNSHSVEFLAQLAILEKQVTEVKAEIALNEGLQRRIEAQLRDPEKDAEV